MVDEVQNTGGAGGAQMPLERQEEFWAQPFTGYKVVNILGEGPAGPVLLARDTRFEREVVIKAIVPDLEAHEDAAERFFNEARQVARLRHDNIVRGVDVGRAGKYLYFVMEYVRGETLEKRLSALQSGRIREIEALQHVIQAAAGLQFIFEQGLAHRNIKPANLMLGGGTLKIADFGVARDLAFPDTQTQALHGAGKTTARMGQLRSLHRVYGRKPLSDLVFRMLCSLCLDEACGFIQRLFHMFHLLADNIVELY